MFLYKSQKPTVDLRELVHLSVLCRNVYYSNVVNSTNLFFRNVITMKINVVPSLVFHFTCATIHYYSLQWLSYLGMDLLEFVTFFTTWTLVIHLVMNLMFAAFDTKVLFETLFETASGINRNMETRLIVPFSKDVLMRLLTYVAVVISFTTQSLFWALFIFDREMILPVSTNFPSVLNHMIHSLPLFLALLSSLMFSFNATNTRSKFFCQAIAALGIKFVAFLKFAYLVLMLYFFETKGTWPYQFMFSFSRTQYVLYSLVLFSFDVTICYAWSLIEFIMIKALFP